MQKDSISPDEQAARMEALKDALKIGSDVQYHIYHTVFAHFSLLDRIRILFGRVVNIEVKIQTGDENVVVLATKTDVWVNKIFPKKARMDGGLHSISGPQIECPVESGVVHEPCSGNCGMNYCDENGCTERKRVLTDPCPVADEDIERFDPVYIKNGKAFKS